MNRSDLAVEKGPDNRRTSRRADPIFRATLLPDLFEARAEQFTPRPVEEAGSISVAGVLFAGLSDAAGVLKQLLGLLEEVAQQSGESHGGP